MTTWILWIGGLLVVGILYKVFTAPVRLLFKFAFNTLLGFVALVLLNKFGGAIGVELGVNWINAAAVGLLGVPGLALLLLVRWLLLT